MNKIKYFFGILIILSAVYYFWTGTDLLISNNKEPKIEQGWHTSLESGIAAAEKENKPVFIDFWATWCKNCIAMDKTTFKDKKVKDKLSSYIKIKVQAENPDDPATKAILDRFKILGLPTYIILAKKKK